MKTCLVLEGGALRGIYTAGVLDVLLENHVEIDTVIGVSAGALFGINYVSKQKGRSPQRRRAAATPSWRPWPAGCR